MLCSLALLALFASVQGRAVNISNTWVLPEEGFPVFYRYFRDRISWYEADAVCQFHHANLVTVDTTAQYDAVRAYLKELDISNAVWVGLIRSNPEGDFTWTDYRGLSGDGYWSSAPDARSAPLCAAADPAADYRWEARACGGPTVASFICELPVPQWALGAEGCMIRALPALTVLYLPESAAVQLTADCGMAGVKRVQCTGNVKREDLLKNLSCAEDEELSSTINMISTDTIFTDSDTTNEPTTEETTTTEHEDDINQPSLSRITINVVNNFTSLGQENLNKDSKSNITFNNIILNKNINLDVIQNNDLQSNDISKVIDDENIPISEHHFEKLEDEKLIQHKLLHDEIARRGNFETIFTQPTDHFVPPLVMAKAKISDDMTVISLEQKHAQQLAEQRSIKHNIFVEKDNSQENKSNYLSSENPNKMEITDMPFVMTTYTNRENEKKEKGKTVPPKKYNEKYDDPKNKISKILIDSKSTTPDTTTERYSISSSTHIIETQATTVKDSYDNSKLEDDPSIDLTVIIKEPDVENGEKIFYSNYSGDVSKIEVIRNESLINVPQNVVTKNFLATTTKYETPMENQTESVPLNQNVTLNHEIIKITILDSTSTSGEPETVYEITTRTPIFKDTTIKNLNIASTSTQQPIDKDAHDNISKKLMANTTLFNEATVSQSGIITTSLIEFTTVSVTPKLNIENITNENSTTLHERLTTTEIPLATATILHNNVTDASETNTTEVKKLTTREPYNNTFSEKIDVFNNTDFHREDHIRNVTDFEDNIDDFQSPLLSAANEPLHRPNRSRRPQTPPSRLNKFNPFRILG